VGREKKTSKIRFTALFLPLPKSAAAPRLSLAEESELELEEEELEEFLFPGGNEKKTKVSPFYRLCPASAPSLPSPGPSLAADNKIWTDRCSRRGYISQRGEAALKAPAGLAAHLRATLGEQNGNLRQIGGKRGATAEEPLMPAPEKTDAENPFEVR